MAWYRAGSVTVTNGSAVVTGAGTSFVANVQAGHAINLPDGRAYEVLSIDSNTQLTLGSNYLGGTANGQAYSVQPNQGFAQTAATRLSDFLTQVSGWVAGALAGRFGDGSLPAPGISFAVDQDTGLRRWGDNTVSIVAGGVDALLAGTAGITLQASGVRSALGTTQGIGMDTGRGLHWVGNGNEALIPSDGTAGWVWQTDGRIVWQTTAKLQKMTLDANGNLLVGFPSASQHTVAKGTTVGTAILNVTGQQHACAVFYAGGGNGASVQPTAIAVAAHAGSGRSINAGGTINASGADYAEYMTKADGCGVIDKGDVCGVDVDGKLTKSWAAAISFVVKSTNPAYVGGDIWSAHLADRPTDPGSPPVVPTMPEVADDATAEDREAAASAYQAAATVYAEAKMAHDAAVLRYEAELPVWEAELQAARQCVDRIAFVGQVPVNITGDFAIGDYLIAAAKGGGIQAIAVAAADITFDQYRRRLGKVWAIRDGRPWIDVQHG